MNPDSFSSASRSTVVSVATVFRLGDREFSVRRAVAGLLLLTLLLRLLAAYRLEVVCLDGAYYIQAAAALEAGDFPAAFSYTGHNIYPPILVAVKWLVGDYETGAKLWGVVVATLTMLPLWGLFRRQFDEKIAAVACFLYAVHPGLIKWAAEPIRDPTFWFLLTLTLYLLQRARQTQSPGWFAAVGATTALAVHTRTEGWLVFLPALGGAVAPLFSAHRRWARPLALCCVVAAVPALLIASLALSGVAGFRWARLDSAATIVCAAPTHQGSAKEAHSTVISPQLASSPPKILAKTASGTLLRYAEQLIKALSPATGILCLMGLIRYRRLLLTVTHGPTAVMNVLLLLCIGLYLQRHGEINTRYFLPVLICCLPFAALQLLDLADDLARLFGNASHCRLAPYAAVMLLTCLGIAGACRTPETARVDMAALGRSLRATYGEHLVLAGFGNPFLVTHYAAPKEFVGLTCPPNALTLYQIDWKRPDAILLQGRPDAVAQYAEFLDGHGELGFRPADLSDIVAGENVLKLYVAENTPAVARRTATDTGLKR